MRPSPAHWAYTSRRRQLEGRAGDDPQDDVNAHAPIYYSTPLADHPRPDPRVGIKIKIGGGFFFDSNRLAFLEAGERDMKRRHPRHLEVHGRALECMWTSFTLHRVLPASALMPKSLPSVRPPPRPFLLAPSVITPLVEDIHGANRRA